MVRRKKSWERQAHFSPPGLRAAIFFLAGRSLGQRSCDQLEIRCLHQIYQKRTFSDEFKVKSFAKTKEKSEFFFLTAIRRERNYLLLAAESPRRLVPTWSSRGRLMQARPGKDDKTSSRVIRIMFLLTMLIYTVKETVDENEEIMMDFLNLRLEINNRILSWFIKKFS